ncbi:unnamed protein product [Pedinophyceae sp. YPF-701]|nr:unnamed protein product [Pedinophyceae sp. YPF-701]
MQGGGGDDGCPRVATSVESLFPPTFNPGVSNERVVSVIIPSYRETPEEMSLSLGCYTKEALPDEMFRQRLELFLILDGHDEKEPEESNPTLCGIKALLKKRATTPIEQVDTRLFRLYRGKYCGIPFGFYIKRAGLKRGKRFSQLFYYEMTQIRRVVLGWEPYALFQGDGDTSMERGALQKLVNSLVENPSCAATTGQILPLNFSRWSVLNPLVDAVAPQVWEYTISGVVDKAFYAASKCVLVMPGAFSLLRYSAVRDCWPAYSARTRAGDLISLNCLDLGEDRYLTTLLLMCGHDTTYVEDAVSYTSVPQTWRELLVQRRRWFNSAVLNDVILALNWRTLFRWHACRWLVYVFTVWSLLCGVLLQPAMTLALFATADLPTDATIRGHRLRYRSYESHGLPLGCPIGALIYASTSCVMVALGTMMVLNPRFHAGTLNYAFLLLLCLVGAIVFGSTTWLIGARLSYFVLVPVVVIPTVLLSTVALRVRPKEWLRVLAGGILGAVIFLPIFSVVIPMNALANLNNGSWGTRETKKDAKTTEQEIAAEARQAQSERRMAQSFVRRTALELVQQMRRPIKFLTRGHLDLAKSRTWAGDELVNLESDSDDAESSLPGHPHALAAVHPMSNERGGSQPEVSLIDALPATLSSMLTAADGGFEAMKKALFRLLRRSEQPETRGQDGDEEDDDVTPERFVAKIKSTRESAGHGAYTAAALWASPAKKPKLGAVAPEPPAAAPAPKRDDSQPGPGVQRAVSRMMNGSLLAGHSGLLKTSVQNSSKKLLQPMQPGVSRQNTLQRLQNGSSRALMAGGPAPPGLPGNREAPPGPARQLTLDIPQLPDAPDAASPLAAETAKVRFAAPSPSESPSPPARKQAAFLTQSDDGGVEAETVEDALGLLAHSLLELPAEVLLAEVAMEEEAKYESILASRLQRRPSSVQRRLKSGRHGPPRNLSRAMSRALSRAGQSTTLLRGEPPVLSPRKPSSHASPRAPSSTSRGTRRGVRFASSATSAVASQEEDSQAEDQFAPDQDLPPVREVWAEGSRVVSRVPSSVTQSRRSMELPGGAVRRVVGPSEPFAPIDALARLLRVRKLSQSARRMLVFWVWLWTVILLGAVFAAWRMWAESNAADSGERGGAPMNSFVITMVSVFGPVPYTIRVAISMTWAGLHRKMWVCWPEYAFATRRRATGRPVSGRTDTGTPHKSTGRAVAPVPDVEEGARGAW